MGTVYLKKATLLESVSHGRFRITGDGQDLLQEGPPALSAKALLRYEEFAEFIGSKKNFKSSKSQPESVSTTPADVGVTPDELLEQVYGEIRATLIDELLEQVRVCSPEFFERLVVQLLVAMGYGGSVEDAGQVVGKSGDEGVDGIIKEDQLGLDVIYLQAKRWKSNVGRPEIQAFVGSLEGFRARKGVVITTSEFAKSAHDYVASVEKSIVLIGGRQLAELMIDNSLGVSEVASYSLNRIDRDFFEE